MSVHPDLTAWRAVDACGGIYTAAEMSSRFAEGHSAALHEAMVAVGSADGLTATLLDAVILALPYVEAAMEDDAYKPGSVAPVVARMKHAIDRATGPAT